MSRWQNPWMVEQAMSSTVATASANVAACARGEPVRERDPHLGRNVAGGQPADEVVHARLELACGELGEGDGGHRLRRDARRQQHGDAACHHGRLAGTGAGLDEQRPVEGAYGRAPGVVVLQGLQGCSAHVASQTAAASASRSATAAALRSQ